MKTFTWFPDINTQQEIKPAVNITKFGDGYEHRVAVGINNQPKKWSLQFDRSRSEAKKILDFFEEHAGVNAFDWKTPLEEEGRYVCREWNSVQKKGTVIISCTFEQVFEY